MNSEVHRCQGKLKTALIDIGPRRTWLVAVRVWVQREVRWVPQTHGEVWRNGCIPCQSTIFRDLVKLIHLDDLCSSNYVFSRKEK